MNKIRVRFAPSPTGNLHIGGARTALFNWLFARKNNGVFILRLENTDLERNIPEAEEGITKSLQWLGLDWDEGPDRGGPYGPYRQSERLAIYRREAERLLAAGLAYRCYCSPGELAAQREEARKKGLAPRYSGRCRELTGAERARLENAGINPAIRVKIPQEGVTTVKDLIRGEVTFENNTLDDFVIMKSNGVPTYNFACVVDDSLMQISHVIRAEEHLSNTPKQVLLYKLLGCRLPAFAHVPMILAPDRSKLSKRHGATSVEEFREGGYFPEALVNYLALLGWSPGDEREMMPVEEIIASFSLEGVSKHAAIYDLKKLTWLNGQYLNALPLERVINEAIPFFQARGYISENSSPEDYAYVQQVAATVRSRVHTLVELVDAADYFFQDNFTYDEKGVKKFFSRPETADLLQRGKDVLAKTEPFDLPTVEAAYRNLVAELGISGGALIHPTRLAISGKTMGPGLFDLIVVLGKKKCLERLDRAIQFIRRNAPPEP
ncbi:MAG: glutamate--tRNA ligase [Armatimonadetes bacterium]|nr:glutamate--tRNA ligase [Armatimonadota bacterium]